MATALREVRTFNLNGQIVPVKTLDDARRLWCLFRDSADGAHGGMFGASDMVRGCGEYREAGLLVARVSYNGRMWTPAGAEIR
jgi:hypothetical protein